MLSCIISKNKWMFKSSIFRLLFSPSLIFLCIGCSTNYVEPAFRDLDLELVTVDINWVKKNTFDRNENIVFAVQATNNSDEIVELGSSWDFCQLPNTNQEYLMVYQRKSLLKIPIGRPFETPVNCIAINLPIRLSPNSQDFIAGARWLDNPQNTPLEAGTYYSSFSIVIGNKSFNSECSFVVE